MPNWPRTKNRRDLKPLLWAILPFLLFATCSRSETAQVILQGGSGQAVSFRVEIARTAEERVRGLMYRKKIPKRGGMLFLFPQETETSFWMKNTEIPLDLLFLDRAGAIVDLFENAIPYSESPINSRVPFRYLLEVKGGTVAREEIRIGDSVEIPHSLVLK